MKSIRIPWYQKPLLKNNEYINIQKGAVFASLFSLVGALEKKYNCFKRKRNQHLIIFNQFQFVALFTIVTSLFDIYCLAMAAPGSTHYGYYFISYEFVYVGNRHGN